MKRSHFHPSFDEDDDDNDESIREREIVLNSRTR